MIVHTCAVLCVTALGVLSWSDTSSAVMLRSRVRTSAKSTSLSSATSDRAVAPRWPRWPAAVHWPAHTRLSLRLCIRMLMPYSLLREYYICRMMMTTAVSIKSLNWLMIFKVFQFVLHTCKIIVKRWNEQSIPMLSNFPGQPSHFPWLFQTFPYLRSFSMIFHTWEIYNLNSKLFQDLYEPCNEYFNWTFKECIIKSHWNSSEEQ